jgi:hypothetical protein
VELTQVGHLADPFQLIFSVAMIASFVQVFIESFQRAIDKENQETVALSALGIG